MPVIERTERRADREVVSLGKADLPSQTVDAGRVDGLFAVDEKLADMSSITTIRWEAFPSLGGNE